MAEPETYFARDRRTWRAWLRRNHQKKSEIWLVLNKKHVQRACVSYDAAVEEALCFGWIDGKLRRIDDEQHMVRFTPRKPRSVWSESNKRRVARLIAAQRMTEAGMALVRAAQENGRWDAEPRTAGDTPPEDLAAALARNQRAQRNFTAFAPSYRKNYIRWVVEAKRPQTRQRRIREVVRRAAQNKKPGMI